MTKVGIVGLGVVGSALKTLLGKSKEIELVFYDPPKGIDDKSAINSADIVFICVPTDEGKNGNPDLSILEEAINWIGARRGSHIPLIIIKSTVPPGTTDRLLVQYQKTIISNPEFLRDQTAAEDMLKATRTVLGGDREACLKVARLYQKVYDHDMIYVFTDARTAEMVKYTTNAFYSTKVSFFNEIYEICRRHGVDYEVLKEIVLLEPRIGRSHTIVTEERGFGGKCLPKDLKGLIKTAEKKGYEPKFLKEVWESNTRWRKET